MMENVVVVSGIERMGIVKYTLREITKERRERREERKKEKRKSGKP
jgi:3-oxoacyl-ACP reductase-like protein